jgi:2-methylcitrate dehydratase PrpD
MIRDQARTGGGRSDLATGFTARVADAVLAIRSAAIAPDTLERVRHAVLDWTGVTIAGANEPSAAIVRSVLLQEGGRCACRLLGTSHRMSPAQAAIANGVAGHALDYDDNMEGVGHSSVPVLSAVFALAEELGTDGRQVVRAILAGYQGMALAGIASTTSSYIRGFHTTGTFGAFGAASGCGYLLGLDALALQRALGLAATQAAGLKASFGTMGKHLNAAKAAANGLLAARLAAAGFTGPTDAIEASQGFAAAHNIAAHDFDPDRPERVLGSRFAVELLSFKTHASCAGTHSAIESIRSIRASRPFGIDDIDRVQLVISEALPDVCGIGEPMSGLEGKFSIKHAAALALAGEDTGPSGFTDDRVHDPRFAALRQRMEVVPVERLDLSGPSEVNIHLKSGVSLTASVKANVPVADSGLADQRSRLASKFNGLVVPVLGAERSQHLIELVSDFASMDSIRPLSAATAP